MAESSIQITAEQLNNAEALLINKEAEINELRNQLIHGESQFQLATEEHQGVLAKLEAESKKNTEITFQMTVMENTMLKREMELVELKAKLYKRISNLQTGVASQEHAVDTSSNALKQISRLPIFEGKTIAFNRWINGVTEIFENYPTLKDFQKRALVVESFKGSARDWYDAEPDSNSDFNSFIQQICPSIKLIAGDNNILAIAMLRKQVDPEIRKYVPKAANESFEEHEKRLKAHMSDSQAKFTSYSSRSSNMDVDPITASIQTDKNYAIVAAQYVPYNRKRQLGTNYQRNPFQRSRYPHNRKNTTMTKEQFDEYRNSEQHLSKTPEPPDKSKYVLFAPQLPLQHMPTDSIKPALLNTLNLHLNEEICFKITAKINSLPLTVLLDSGSQITSISESAASRLNLTFKNFKPLLRKQIVFSLFS
ncbi:hypothetical protein BB560_004863 [Smittium megazygosporum]|uniref:Uncharacterized protein n=1 Tax=Smittium megazygosporum TaxID=133381 RepID=A0A2T9Z864_9FUNG|nr:hypothetical protein BB560_004863 [Smittium megazygosporum]